MTADRTPEDLLRLAGPLLTAAGLGPAHGVSRLPGGGNNRVHRLDTAAGPLLLKEYFQHPDDPRDRLAAELAFSGFAWSQGLRMLPQPLTSDPLHRLGLFEFIVGHRLSPAEVTADHVQQAGEFFRAVNARRHAPEAARLPAAAEACFSLTDHSSCVTRRLARLDTIEPVSALHREAADLVHRRLRPLWRDLEAGLTSAAADCSLQMDAPLTTSSRRLSPSDFGFHNALLCADGRLRFLDFEYAGWDDPAKAVCDFFCQPAVPVRREHWEAFLTAAMDSPELTADLRQRAALLLPAYEVKWCCIMLNEFLPLGDSRRAFAGAGESPDVRQAAQLRKVEAVLSRLRP